MKYGEYLILGLLDNEKKLNLKEVVYESGFIAVWCSLCLTNLQKAGFIIKEKSIEKGHRNNVLFSLTPKGQELKIHFINIKNKLNLSWKNCKEFRNFPI